MRISPVLYNSNKAKPWSFDEIQHMQAGTLMIYVK